MTLRKFSNVFAGLLCVSCLIVAPVYGQTQKSNNGSDWQYIGNLYLWGAGVSGITRNGGDIDASFSDIVSNLDFALMGGLEARKSKWSLVGDLLYLNLGDENNATLPVSGANVNANLDLTGWVINLLAGYNLATTPKGLADVFIGARYLDLETNINVSIPAAGAGRNFSDSGNVWDGIIGIRGNLNFNDKWYLPYHLDVGAGDSDLTWQAMLGVGYRLKRWDLVLAYRHIEWEFESDRRLDNINFSGPGFMGRFRF